MFKSYTKNELRWWCGQTTMNEKEHNDESEEGWKQNEKKEEEERPFGFQNNQNDKVKTTKTTIKITSNCCVLLLNRRK